MRKNASGEEASRKAFLERIARMYYVLGLNQQDIADQIGIGRSSVARFLNEAREEGVVQIHVGYERGNSRRNDLENRLIEQYKLKDAIVVKRGLGSSFETVMVDYLDSMLPFQGSIGLSGGRTLYSVGQYMYLCEPRPQLKFIQLSGSTGNFPTTSVIQSWADAVGARPVYLHAPAIVSDKKTRDIFLQNESIEESLKEIRHIDLMIVGIGNIESDSAILNTGYIPGLTVEKLKEKSVGDVIFHFFDANGDFSIPEISQRVVGASPSDLLEVPIRAGMAFGENKKTAILAALKGRIINIILTDEKTAELILEE